jgi:DNA-binding transcriptional regulator GbsR (MarR family)
MASALERSRALFIRRWGELGGYWGISRTMAELHALLYTSAEPLCTDDVIEQLQISRGNASMNLRQLVDWELISRVHKRGDRKEYFVCETDVWEMFQNIARERKRREVEPIIETIDRCRGMVADEKEVMTPEAAAAARVYLDRLQAMERFLSALLDLINFALSRRTRGLHRLTEMLAALIRRRDGKTAAGPAD